MPVLLESLQGRDLGHMRIIAELWGINLEAPDERVARLELVRSLMDAELIEEVVESLPLVARRALEDLVRSEGRMPWSQYIRRYGELREMGPGKRDRERPHLTPVSPVEMLWYRGFVGRAFFDTPGGPEEFAYIPDDLFGLLSGAHELQALPLGRPASPLERLHTFPVDDIILDHACTQLAALRVGIVPPELLASPPGTRYPLNAPVLDALLRTVGLLDEVGLPQPERTREFLETGRAEALAVLVTAWMESRDFNELRLIPELSSEGEWHNDPLLARKSVLEMLSTIPADTWWSLEGFVQDVHNEHPDFQRPAGDYDSWFIRHVQSGDFLRGFEAWDDVDGALLRFLITGPMHWLGIYDLAAPEMQASPTAFKRSRWASTLLSGQAPDGLPREEEKLKVTSDGRIRAARLVPRAVRYQSCSLRRMGRGACRRLFLPAHTLCIGACYPGRSDSGTPVGAAAPLYGGRAAQPGKSTGALGRARQERCHHRTHAGTAYIFAGSPRSVAQVTCRTLLGRPAWSSGGGGQRRSSGESTCHIG
jgi:hypothetical protein